MTQDENQEGKSGFQPVDGMRMIAIAGQVGCVTLLSVFGAVFLGLFLDRILGTRPLILIVLVLASAPVALFLTYYIVTRATRQMTTKAGTKAEEISDKQRGDQ
ncbi:MAG: AtpZ/AtpI family protein [Anaerolineales bacterium]|nr:AtpZ/AtpI family protein [Anaerolineales bacterium]MCS7246767.1 AtpZ/AtpI family protein [Anaerolineales bacterium]MDW8160577.1 AtpZ/AtpI family protein [Anaerolineales bacterium]MDW8447114.1 AtpZ/AtpI family protein [Anaerolineales bacterium]